MVTSILARTLQKTTEPRDSHSNGLSHALLRCLLEELRPRHAVQLTNIDGSVIAASLQAGEEHLTWTQLLSSRLLLDVIDDALRRMDTGAYEVPIIADERRIFGTRGRPKQGPPFRRRCVRVRLGDAARRWQEGMPKGKNTRTCRWCELVLRVKVPCWTPAKTSASSWPASTPDPVPRGGQAEAITSVRATRHPRGPPQRKVRDRACRTEIPGGAASVPKQ
jgi:hypothetical protein